MKSLLGSNEKYSGVKTEDQPSEGGESNNNSNSNNNIISRSDSESVSVSLSASDRSKTDASAHGLETGTISSNSGSLGIGEFHLRLPDFNDLKGERGLGGSGPSSTGKSEGSQFFHSSASHISDNDLDMSVDSDLSYFNARPNLDSEPSSASEFSFKEAKEYDSNSDTNFTASPPLDRNSQNRVTFGEGIVKNTIENLNYKNGKVDFLQDDPKTMTYGRRIALYLSSRYRWYNPQLERKGKDSACEDVEEEKKGMGDVGDGVKLEVGASPSWNEKPSLAVAWAYFEHMTLPRRRRYVGDGGQSIVTGESPVESPRLLRSSIAGTFTDIKKKAFKGDIKYDVAVPGEDDFETKLYHPITTPLNQMGDFGLGVGLYFSTLRAMTVLMTLAGLLNIPNILYFSSQEYSKGQEKVEWFLRGSAVCTVHTWVPCPNCTVSDFAENDRFQHVMDQSSKQTLVFGLRNECDGAKLRTGMVSLATTFLLLIGMICVRFYLMRKEVNFDEDEQTAQDYSIVIRNPPEDAVSPEEWRNFFMEKFARFNVHVTCCTVAVDNDALVAALVKRRELLKSIAEKLPEEPDLSLQNLKQISENMKKERNYLEKIVSKMFKGIPGQIEHLAELSEKIVELSQQSYPASSVFVTFEKEENQRVVLEKMTVSESQAKENDEHALRDLGLKFRGDHVCFVQEPTEPSTIRWQDLNVTTLEHAIKFVTTGGVLGFVAASFFFVRMLHGGENPGTAAFAISISNALFPVIAKILSKFEKHANEERREVWLYIKIALFRCVNVVLPFFLTVPYTQRTADGTRGSLGGVFNIFYAEILTSTALQLLDISENFKRHVLAPRATSQDAMNLNMSGTEIFFAERYTNMTKLIFLSLWHCTLYPAVLFICAIALLVNFFADRFSLMRSWKPSPKIGRSTSAFTRDITFPALLITMVIVASQSWASFNFDSLCEAGTVDETYFGSYDLDERSFYGHTVNGQTIEVNATSTKYMFCQRNNEDMVMEKETLTRIYGTFSIIVAVLVGVAIACLIGLFFRRMYVVTYSPVGKAHDEKFSEVDGTTGYIPQVRSPSFAYPFLVCPVNPIKDCDLFEWVDPHRPYEEYDLTKDSEQLLVDNGKSVDPNHALFCKMIYCPP